MSRFFDQNPANIDEIGRKLIDNAKKAIEISKDDPNRNQIIDNAMNEMYDYFAKYSEEQINNFNFQLEIFKVEQLLSKEYLPINTNPIYDESQKYQPTTETEILDYIIHCTRKEIAKYYDLRNNPLVKNCIMSSHQLEKVCSELGLETIHLGLDQTLNHGMFHHFTIIRIPTANGKYKNYLADCSYRQFFTRNDCNPRRIAVMRGPAKGCSIGTYMLMNEKRKEIAETILTKGYIELTGEVFKEYLDAIVYSGRDKEFYVKRDLDYLNPNDVTPKLSLGKYLEILNTNKLIDDNTLSSLWDDLLVSEEKNIRHNLQ